VVINRIRLDDLIYSLESFLQLNMCRELQIFAFVYEYEGSPKRYRTFFLKIYCSTYNLIKLVSFKVLPSTVDTPLPAFFPVLERVLERVLRDGAKVL